MKNALSFIQSLEEQLFTLKQRLAQLRIKTESLVVIANDHTDDSESQILYGCVDNRDAFQTLKLTQLFCTFLEYLFVSFSDVIDLSNIESLSRSIVHWIEMLNVPGTMCDILTRFYHFEIDCKHIII